eukprot:gene18935-19272_t
MPAAATDAPPATLSTGLTVLFAISVGVTVLSLYASQPLVGLIQADFGLSTSEATLVTTFTLLGYACGLLLLVPLTDLVENRSLIVTTLAVDAMALASVAYAPNVPLFFIACFVSGVTASAIQMLVPVAAQMSAETQRGRVVGNVMSGLMLGILLSRPIASLVAEIAGWRSFYITLACLIAMLAVLLARVLPQRRPSASRGYGTLIVSMLTILREEPVLRRRATYQAFCMGAFGVFWTSVALRLSQPPFSLNQSGIALFALAGAAGAIIAPIAGRVGDRGWTRGGTLVAHASVILAMALAALGGDAMFRIMPGVSANAAVVLLGGAAVLLDLGVIGDQTLGRRAINLLRPEARGRINGLFTGLFFFGAAAGSGLSGIAWAYAGWLGVCLVGTAFGIAALAASTAERTVVIESYRTKVCYRRQLAKHRVRGTGRPLPGWHRDGPGCDRGTNVALPQKLRQALTCQKIWRSGLAIVSGTTAIIAATQTATPTASIHNVSAEPRSQSTLAEGYVGYYQLAPHAVLKIWNEAGHWFVQSTHQPRIEITPIGNGTFKTVGVPAEIDFQTDAQSKNGRELVAPKIDVATASSIDPTSVGEAARTWPARFAGTPRIISTGDDGSDYWPCFSPGGTSLVFAHKSNGR